MKILIVCQHFYPEQFRINDVAFELVKKGHEVTALTGLPNYPKGKIYPGYRWFKHRNQTVNGVKIKRVSIPGRGNGILKMGLNYAAFALFGKLRAFFMKKDFDIALVYQISPITMAWPAITVKKSNNIPLIIHCLDQWPISITTGGISKDSFIYKILYRISINTYKKADTITLSSQCFKKYFEEVLGFSEEDKGLIYWPTYAESDYENIKKTDNNVFDLVFAGNIGPAQSVETLIEAANLLKDEKDIMFHIVGDGLSKKDCEDLANKYNLKNVKFYGFFPVSEMPRFYNLADAFVITMLDNEVVNNTMPAKAQSYMLAKKPIIGAISGEVKRVIEEADCGLCCDSLDYKTLAENILKAKDQDKKLSKWGENAYNYYMKYFNKEVCMNQFEQIMNKVVNEKRKNG